jgi:hypothetical protein
MVDWAIAAPGFNERVPLVNWNLWSQFAGPTINAG